MRSNLSAFVFALVVCGIHCQESTIKIWEGKSQTVSCHDDQTILITSADYGRTSRNCHSSNALKITKKECDSFSSCTLYANNAEFGDPCRFVRKYLQVSYRCESTKSNPLKRVRICEHRQQSIECPSGRKIAIKYANYGRLKGSHVCGGPVRSTKCEAKKSLSIVLKECQDKTRCFLQASNGNFGDPCVGTYKYLEVHYRCKDDDEENQLCKDIY